MIMDSRLSLIQNTASRRPRKGDVCIGNETPKLPLGARNGHASWPIEKKYHKRRKSRSLLRRSWTLPLMLTLATLFLYALNPTNSNAIHHFLFLSYKVDDLNGPVQYGKGPRDLAFVGFYTILLSFAREFVMHEVLRPLARSFGIKSRAKQLRFMEQMYIVFYIAFMGPFGMYCMKQTPVWYFNTRGMYEGFPHKTHNANIKFYYLFQAAFWVQQSIVMLLGFEQRRKDFKELVGHHIVTIALIGLSYRFHFTYMGIAVYVTHDISDFFLAALNLFWLYCLLRNAYRFIFLGIAKDDRSEDEAPETDNVEREKDNVVDTLVSQGKLPSLNNSSIST
ncbi:Sphingosine N-acyltransferase lac1 [Daldinia childiae]|uniref:Sphingosine N-acyltransferase lac1 n=1 Tax=Daldinia childiae TaxID=326645 RepID=UPI0014476A1F|nr:Sphingosine N-acyltransferase lac1 [Daldinia childiae]KAF3067196.1 Sphingosine N-acyltransferase lac1 [Daldinia childiae]